MALDKLTKPQPDDVLRAGTLNLTLVSGFVGAIGIILDAIPGVMETVVGTSTAGVRAAIFIAIIASFAVVATADILSRGYASAHKPKVEPKPLAWALRAERDDKDAEGDRRNWEVVALREAPSTNGDGAPGLEFLVAKVDRHPAWVAQDKLRFTA